MTAGAGLALPPSSSPGGPATGPPVQDQFQFAMSGTNLVNWVKKFDRRTIVKNHFIILFIGDISLTKLFQDYTFTNLVNQMFEE